MGEANKMSSITKKINQLKKKTETIEESYAKLVELIQSNCVHRRLGVFSEEGHNFVHCLDCGKRFYGIDI